MNKGARIYVAGHRGLVGSALIRQLSVLGYENLVVKTHRELELTDRRAVGEFFEQEKPEYVFLAAARVGGIQANSQFPVDFLQDNLHIQNNVIEAAYTSGARKLLFLGSSCIYPRLAEQPLREDALLTGPLEPTNEWYAIAKIAGIKLCQAYRQQYGFDAISVMPTNLYGPDDNFDLESSHVLPALMRKCHEAKIRQEDTVVLWGSGRPRREFLHADEMADACIFLMQTYSSEDIINIGVGDDLTIRELAELIAEVTGFEGMFEYDTSKPDGTPRKLMDVSRLNKLGWRSNLSLREGLQATYDAFRLRP
ncbi:MAG: GDP-fucose synthetase [Salinisphaeraceae bacterium]|nr:GDP-fucose synthetase [Salinisphaeraceae bacterium]